MIIIGETLFLSEYVASFSSTPSSSAYTRFHCFLILDVHVHEKFSGNE